MPELESYDRLMTEFLEGRHVRGAKSRFLGEALAPFPQAAYAIETMATTAVRIASTMDSVLRQSV